MIVSIRTDASTIIGSGHAMRCLTLARKLRSRGASVVFMMRPLCGNLISRVREDGFPVIEVGRSYGTSHLDEETDAELSANAIRSNNQFGVRPGTGDSWVIVDHYGFGKEWEKRVRTVASRILAIDDLADRVHDADVLLDQNLVANFMKRYDGLVSGKSIKLLGPDYALIADRYRELRKDINRVRKATHFILVYFGGADNEMTLKTVDALARLPQDYSACVILDRANPQAVPVQTRCAADGRISILGQLPDLAQAMTDTDLFIGACGTTSWERLALGLRAAVVTLADNQVPLARELERQGFIKWLGRSETITIHTLFQGLQEILAVPVDPVIANRMMSVVDSLGTERVADIVMHGGADRLELRPVRRSDSDVILNWANDPVTRNNAFKSGEISRQEHDSWFDRCLSSPDTVFLLAETPNGIPIGHVRFERQTDWSWEISYAVAPLFRRRGIARPMLGLAVQKLLMSPDRRLVSGYVKPANQASVKVFESLGFQIAEIQDKVEAVRYELARSG